MDNVSIQDFELDRNLTDAERASAVQVNWLDWKIVDAYEEGDLHRERAASVLARLGVSPDTHVVVGHYYRDLSGWCEYEGKMEYHHDERVLVVRA